MICPSLLALKNGLQTISGWHSGCSFLLLAICPVAIGSCKWFVCLLLFLHSSCKYFLPFSGCELWLLGGQWKSAWKGWEVSICCKSFIYKVWEKHSWKSQLWASWVLPFFCGVDCIALPWHGMAPYKGRSRGTLPPCVQTPSLQIIHGKKAWKSFDISAGTAPSPLHKNKAPAELSLVAILNCEIFSNSPQHWQTCLWVMSCQVFPHAGWTCKVGLCWTRSLKGDICHKKNIYKKIRFCSEKAFRRVGGWVWLCWCQSGFSCLKGNEVSLDWHWHKRRGQN